MDAVAADEFQDWEVVPSASDSESTPLNSADEIESGGLFQENYFSENPPNRAEEVDDELSGESDGLSCWVDAAPAEDDESNGEKEESLGSSCSEIEKAVSGKVCAFEENSNVDVVPEKDEKNDGEVERRRGTTVWWKMPMAFLKNSVFKTSPMWTLSAAAAAMVGFVMLIRRLNKMKRKAKGLQIKVTCNDKRASQHAMSGAARVNEAFMIVKRVPVVIRPPPPPSVGLGTSTATWPVMF